MGTGSLLYGFTVRRFETRGQLGERAARDVAETLLELLQAKDCVNMVFAAAPSQLEFLEAFRADPRIDFTRIRAFHMDEYIGLPAQAPQGFGAFLRRNLFDRVPLREAYLIDGLAADPEAECARYARLLRQYPPDIVCMGIGENGHIAFNDPGVADFDDALSVKVVALDPVCRRQQVNDGCFQKLADVPLSAVTLTVPALARAPHHFCMVPAATKAGAVRRTVMDAVTAACPATILRTCPHATLYVDADSGRYLRCGAREDTMKLSVITDEFTQDIDEAVALALRYRLDGLELRSVGNKGLFELPEAEARIIAGKLEAAGLRVSALAAPFFKCDINDEAQVEAHIAGLAHCIGLAAILHTRLIRGFTFWRLPRPAPLARIAARFQKPVQMLREAGVTLVLESDPSVNACNAAELAEVVSAVGAPEVRALWDPGNDLFAPERERPFPDGYDRIRPWLRHVHLKDAVRDAEGHAEACRLGCGQADIPGLLRALRSDGYGGYLTVETHYRRKIALTDAALQLPGGASFSEDGLEPTLECLDALLALLGRGSAGKE